MQTGILTMLQSADGMLQEKGNTTQLCNPQVLINGPSPWSNGKCRVMLVYVQSALTSNCSFPARVKNMAEDSHDIRAIITNFCRK